MGIKGEHQRINTREYGIYSPRVQVIDMLARRNEEIDRLRVITDRLAKEIIKLKDKLIILGFSVNSSKAKVGGRE